MKTANLHPSLRMVRLRNSRFLRLALVIVLLLGRPSAFASGTATLKWNAVGDPRVTGYNLYYGGNSGAYTNSVNVGDATNITISGLVAGLTYYFAATSYTAARLESAFSNEVAQQVPLPVILNLQINRINGIPVSMTVSASGTIPHQWTLQSSTNLQTWVTLAQGTNLAVNFLMPVNNLPMQFLRLLGQ